MPSLCETRSCDNVLLLHQVQRVHQFHLRLIEFWNRYTKRSGTLCLLCCHLACHAEASQRLIINQLDHIYKGGSFHRGNTDSEEGADNGGERATSGGD